MKDKEWAQKEIDRYLSYEGVNEARNALVFAKGVIDQLDEPEVTLDEPEILSQEWVHENKEMYLINDTSENAVPAYKLQNLLVPKQELPVIPKYVDEWIIRHRDILDLYPALRELENNTLGWERTYKWYRMNTHKFVNAFLTGEYEVEEEQKYNVQLKPRSSFGTVGIFLYKQGDEVLAGDNFKTYYPEKDESRLTEQEIKDFDPRYWEFRKPV